MVKGSNVAELKVRLDEVCFAFSFVKGEERRGEEGEWDGREGGEEERLRGKEERRRGFEGRRGTRGDKYEIFI